MATSSSRIEMLFNDNYDTRSMQEKGLLLTKNNIWDYVDGTNNMLMGVGVKSTPDWLKTELKRDSTIWIEQCSSIQPSELKQIWECET